MKKLLKWLKLWNVAHIKEKETDKVNKMCLESNAFELQKKKNVFWVRWKMARKTLSVQHGKRRVLNATIITIFPGIVKIKGETCHITYKRNTICSYCRQDKVTINRIRVNLN